MGNILSQIIGRNKFAKHSSPDKIICSDILNLYKDESGHIRVVPDFKSLINYNHDEIYVFIHNIDETTNILIFDYKSYELFYFREGNYDKIGDIYGCNNIDIQGFGSMIVITDKSNYERYFSVYNNGAYDGINIVKRPDIKFTLYGENFTAYDYSDTLTHTNSNEWDTAYGYALPQSEIKRNSLHLSSSLGGYYVRCESGDKTSDNHWKYKGEYSNALHDMFWNDIKKGLMSGYVLVRVGLRMYDGSIGYISMPKLIASGIVRDGSSVDYQSRPILHKKVYTFEQISTYTVFRYTVRGLATGTLTINIECDLSTIDKRFIKGICIFCSKPLYFNVPEITYKYDEDVDGFIPVITFRSQVEKLYNEEYISNAQYFLAKELAVSENIIYTFNDVDWTLIDTKEKLELYNYQDSIIGDIQFKYNGRLYDGGLRIKPYTLHNEHNFRIDSSGNDYGSVVELSINNKDIAVNGNDFKVDGDIGLCYFVTYPNAKAKIMRVINRSSGKQLKFKKDISNYVLLELTSNGFDNYSYFIFKDLIIYKYYDDYFPRITSTDEHLTFSSSNIQEIDYYESLPSVDVVYDSNTLAISEINNPFVYHYNNIMSIGSGRILGIGSQSTPTSTGQFGQYPIIVITTDGVYLLDISMNVDIVVSRVIKVLNRFVDRISNVANIHDALCYADNYNVNTIINGVVNDFTKGVIRLDTDEDEDKIASSINYNKLSGNIGYSDYVMKKGENVLIAYSSVLDGIIVGNILLQSNGFISRIDKKIKRVFQSGGKVLVIFEGGNSVYDLGVINSESNNNKLVAFISNSITNYGYLKIGHITIHGDTNKNEYNILGVYGSDDDIHYYPIMISSSKKKDISLSNLFHSTKYFKMVYFGMGNNEFSIDMISMSLVASIFNK